MNVRTPESISSKNCKGFQFSNPKAYYLLPIQIGPFDYIAVSKSKTLHRFAVISAKVVNELMASDHRPILVGIAYRLKKAKHKIFRTKPYLQNPGNGITVMWETTVSVRYCWNMADTTRLERARMIVDGQVVCTTSCINTYRLQPGQKYYYRVCSQEMLLSSGI